MILRECLDMELVTFCTLLFPKPGSAFGIPLTTAVPLVTDVTTPKKVARQGIDYHTALDLVNMVTSEREKWTTLGPSSLLIIRDDDRNKPDDEKTRFYLRPVV